MSLMVIPDEGKILWLYWALCTDGSDLEDFILKTYKNNYTPVDGSTAGDFTESNFTGYSSVAIARSSLPDPTITSHVAITTRSAVPTFTCTAGAAQDMYGWYLVGAVSGDVVAAQRFDNPRNMAPGAQEQIQVQFKFKTFA